MIIKHGLVVDPASGLSEHMDILVKNGKIARIAPEISEDSEEILEAGGLVVGPGLIDTHVHFRDPGFTYKENIHTGAKASAKGGFTTVICMANTSPTVDNTDTLKDRSCTCFQRRYPYLPGCCNLPFIKGPGRSRHACIKRSRGMRIYR